MPQRKLLDLSIWCPWSGITLKGKRIKPHKTPVMQCVNGVLFSKCALHGTRSFSSDMTLIKSVLEESKVIMVTEAPPKKERRTHA